MARKKYVAPPPLSLHEIIRNMIKTSSKTYNGNDHTTTLATLHFYMHGHPKQDVYDEVAKWVDLSGVTDETPIILPAKFFN